MGSAVHPHPLLTIDSVTKAFGRLVAVSNVSLTVGKGEVFGIAGPNGAGKSTLFNLITGVPFRADAGQIRFREREIARLSPDAICTLGIARTFQTETAFESLTVEQNVRVAAVHGHGQRRSVDQRVNEAVDFFSLGQIRHQSARHLSLYEKKRLMLASAWATAPELLLLDEPASGLNVRETEETADLIRSISGQGVAVLLIEHVLPLLLEVSSRVMIMVEGTKLVEGKPEEVTSDERVIEVYIGEHRGRRRSASRGR